MSSGIEIGNAAMQLLDRGVIKQHPPHGPSITVATESLSRLTGTKAELLEAIAYLALQVAAYRNIANEDATLAIYNIESIIKRYREIRA